MSKTANDRSKGTVKLFMGSLWRSEVLKQVQNPNEAFVEGDSIFRLASNFLLSTASLDWFYYLIYSPRTLTDPPIQHNGEDVYVYRRDDTPMATRHQKADAALQRLAMVHTIEPEDLGVDDNDDERRLHNGENRFGARTEPGRPCATLRNEWRSRACSTNGQYFHKSKCSYTG